MSQIIENYIILPGLIGLLIIVALKIHTFNSYKRIKQKLDPNFNPLNYQGWIGNVFFMNIYMLEEEIDESAILKKIIKKHNKLLKLLIIYLILLCFIVITLSAINTIFF